MAAPSSFTPQPFPLFAVTVEPADDPIRPESTASPVRMVLGWTADETGQPRPVLEGSPELTVWTGAITYHESRDLAEETAAALARASRSVIRENRVRAWVAALTGKVQG